MCDHRRSTHIERGTGRPAFGEQVQYKREELESQCDRIYKLRSLRIIVSDKAAISAPVSTYHLFSKLRQNKRVVFMSQK